MQNFMALKLHLMVPDLSNEILYELNNILVTHTSLNWRMRDYNENLLYLIKRELIKRELVSEYVLDYQGKL
jgi:hypothetical protein